MKKRTKVAIIGFASSSRDQAPYDDDSFDIWSLNHAYGHVPRWDAWFEIHPRSHFERDLMRDNLAQDGKRHVEWLAKEPADGRPIWCQEHYDDIPASRAWPRAEINEWFRRQGGLEPAPLGFYADDYWTSTPGQMLGHAIWAGYEEIHLYGIDMLQSEEYFYQRSGCEYYVAFARARGIRVYVPPTSALCKANYTYGYTEPPTDIQHMQPYLDYLGTKVQESNLNKEKASSAAMTIDGGLQAFRIIASLVKDGILVRDKEAPPGEGGLHPVVRDADGNPTRRPCTLEDIRAECEEQITKLEPKQREAMNTVVAMDGQMAGFRCSQSWAEHYARGGKLA